MTEEEVQLALGTAFKCSKCEKVQPLHKYDKYLGVCKICAKFRY